MEIKPEKLQEKINTGKCLIIDVRTPIEYQSLHIKNATNIPLDILSEKEILELADKNEEIFVVCQSGKRGETACKKLAEFGFTNVSNIIGGTLACNDAGLDVVLGKKSVSLERQVRIAAGAFILIGFLGSFYISSMIYLSAFVGAGLLFSGITDTCGMALVLAKMPWNKINLNCEKKWKIEL